MQRLAVLGCLGALALLGALVGTVAVRESLATECHRAVAEVVWEEAVAGATYEFVILEAGGRVLHNREATEGTACHPHFTELYEVYTPDQRRRLCSGDTCTDWLKGGKIAKNAKK